MLIPLTSKRVSNMALSLNFKIPSLVKLGIYVLPFVPVAPVSPLAPVAPCEPVGPMAPSVPTALIPVFVSPIHQ